MRHLLVCMLVLLVGCGTTPQGKSIDRSNLADLGTTAIALSAGGVEANPLGLALIPAKLAMGYVVDTTYHDNCLARQQAATIFNTIYYGVSFNNLAVAVGASSAPIVGLVGGFVYYWFKESLEPREVYKCGL